MEQIIVAFEGERTAGRVRELIETSGLAACSGCHTGAEVKRLVHEQGIPAVICGYKLRDETAESLFADLPPGCAMLVLAPQSYLDLIGERGIRKLWAPATRSELLSAVAALFQEAGHLRPLRTEEERAVIGRAKTLLMERRSMTEEGAHRYLQKRSMDGGLRLAAAAQTVLDELEKA